MHCLIVEDQPVTLFGLEVLITKEFPGWSLSSATTCNDAIKLIDGLDGERVDLALIDTFSNDDGLSLIEYLRKAEAGKHSTCIAMSRNAGPDFASRCKEVGATACVSKADSLADILRVIVAVMPARGRDAVRLTARQKDVVQLVMEGHSNKRIANALNLSYGTVKNYMFDLMRIFAVTSRLELAMRCKEDSILLHRHKGITPRKLACDFMRPPEADSRICPS